MYCNNLKLSSCLKPLRERNKREVVTTRWRTTATSLATQGTLRALHRCT